MYVSCAGGLRSGMARGGRHEGGFSRRALEGKSWTSGSPAAPVPPEANLESLEVATPVVYSTIAYAILGLQDAQVSPEGLD